MTIKSLVFVILVSGALIFGAERLSAGSVSNHVDNLLLVNNVLADPLASASSVVSASSLTAPTAQEFKKKQLLAGRLQVAQLLVNLVALVSASIYAKNNWTNDKMVGLMIMLFWVLVRPALCIESIIQHFKYANNAEQLHALLQDEEFKKQLGVADWGKVRDSRQGAEMVSLTSASALGLLNWWSSGDKERTIISLILKPILSAVMSKKVMAPSLEAAFNRAISGRKRK